MKPEKFDVSLWISTLRQCDDEQAAAKVGSEMLDNGCLGDVLRDERVMGEPVGFSLLLGLERYRDRRAIAALIDGISGSHPHWNRRILDVIECIKGGCEISHDLRPALTRLITACPREFNLEKIDPNWASSADARNRIGAILETIIEDRFGANTRALEAISGWEQTPKARATVPRLIEKLAQESELGPMQIVALLDKIDSDWRASQAASDIVPTLAKYALLNPPHWLRNDETPFLRCLLSEIDPCWSGQIDWNAIVPEMVRQALESTGYRHADIWLERLNDLGWSSPILQCCQSELAKLRQELNKGSEPAAMLLIRLRDVPSLGTIWGSVARFDNNARLLSDLARWTADTGESKYVPQLGSLLKHSTDAKWDAAETLARIGTPPAIKALRSFKSEEHKWYHGEDPDMEDNNARRYDVENIFECFAHACGGDESGRDRLYKYRLYNKDLSMGTWLAACMSLECLCIPSGTSEETLNTQLATMTSVWESNQEDTAVSLRLARLWEVRLKQVQDEQSLDGALFFYELIQKKYPESVKLLDYKLATLGVKRHQIRIKLLEDWLASGGEQHEGAQLYRDELTKLRQEVLAMTSTAAKIKRASFSNLDS